jgi:biotin operon repressor
MLDYKDIITKHFGLGMSGRQIAKELGVSKSGVNDVIGAFKRVCDTRISLARRDYQLCIGAQIYGNSPVSAGRDTSFVYPDYENVHKQLHSRKNMTLVICEPLHEDV